MKMSNIKIECNMVAGKPNIIAKIHPDTTPRFIAHMRAKMPVPFSITFNAGVEDGNWHYDLCSLDGADAERIITAFRPV
jgi:hypothetical protein